MPAIGPGFRPRLARLCGIATSTESSFAAFLRGGTVCHVETGPVLRRSGGAASRVRTGGRRSATGVFVQTTALSLRDDVTPPANPGKRKLSSKAATKRDAAANRIVVPAPGSPSDPILGGTTLVFQGTGGTTDRVQLSLPAARWTI